MDSVKTLFSFSSNSRIFSTSVFLELDLDRFDLDEALEDELDPELDLSRRRDLDLDVDSLLRLLFRDLDLTLLLLSLSLMVANI